MIDQIPLPVFFIIIVAGALLFIEAGFIQGQRLSAKHPGESDASIGAMIAAVLGLLAFMLTFTFGLAAGRFDERRELIIQESNAIGTTYLRADFLEEPARTNVKSLLKKYVRVRIDITEHPENINESVDKSNQLQQELWDSAVDVSRKHPTPISGLFVSTVNDVIDLQAKRITMGLHTRVPITVWLCLLFVSALSMAGVGYYSGRTRTRAWCETTILIATFGAVLLLVADLDRPHQGLIKVDQQPMLDLAKQIGA